MVEVRTIADGFLNYTKATAISLNGIRLLCYLGILSILIPGAFGGGDIKFMAVSGFLLGKEKIICSMACAVMLAGGYCLIMLKCGKLTRKDEFAFGPFLVLGIMMTLFAGDQLILWFWQGI